MADALQILDVDDRCPLPEADLERVFDPFVRRETSRSRATGGVDVRLANRDGGGLATTLSLPLMGSSEKETHQ